MDMMPLLVGDGHQALGITMRCRLLSCLPWSGWQALSSLLRGPFAAARMIATRVGGTLLLMPAGTAWPYMGFADAVSSATIFDWAKGALGLMFFLRRQLGAAYNVDRLVLSKWREVQ